VVLAGVAGRSRLVLLVGSTLRGVACMIGGPCSMVGAVIVGGTLRGVACMLGGSSSIMGAAIGGTMPCRTVMREWKVVH